MYELYINGNKVKQINYIGEHDYSPVEPVDCSDWENLGYSSYEDCDCQVNGNCE